MGGNMERTRKWYGVPAKRGGRIAYTGDGVRVLGTIKGARDCRLIVLLDGIKNTVILHPTWKIEYLPAAPEVQK